MRDRDRSQKRTRYERTKAATNPERFVAAGGEKDDHGLIDELSTKQHDEPNTATEVSFEERLEEREKPTHRKALVKVSLHESQGGEKTSTLPHIYPNHSTRNEWNEKETLERYCSEGNAPISAPIAAPAHQKRASTQTSMSP